MERVPSREKLVSHLSERGFQVVAAGDTEQELRTLFCIRRVSRLLARFASRPIKENEAR